MICKICDNEVNEKQLKKHIHKHGMSLYDYGKMYNMPFHYIGRNKDIEVKDFNNKCFICGNSFDLTIRRNFIEIIKCKTYNCSGKKFDNVLKQLFNDKKTIDYYIDEHNKKLLGRFSEEYFIKKYGKEEGIKRRKHWIDTCKTGKETLIKRYGEEEGLKRFEIFKEKSKQNKKNFIKRYGEDDGSKKWNDYIELKKKTSKRSLLYWLEYTDGDHYEAKKLHKEHQATSTLNKFQKKYGDVEGLKKYNELNDKKTRNWDNGYRFSKISLKLFNEINKNITYEPYFGKSNEFRLLNKYNVDFYIKELNLCIEFNGDFWHANPSIYEEDDWHPIKKIKAKDIWEKDKERIKELNSNTNFLLIWENETKDFDEVLNKCLNFIKEIENERNNN